jgi:hypothetical protein
LEPPITHSGLTILWILYELDILQLLGLPGLRTLYMRQRMNGRDDDVSHRFLSTTLKSFDIQSRMATYLTTIELCSQD